MSTLALFWPHPRLAAACDPLTMARRHPDQLIALTTAQHEVHAAVLRSVPGHLWGPRYVGDVSAWEAVFGWSGALPDDLPASDALDALSGTEVDDAASPDAGRGLARHVEQAGDTIADPGAAAQTPGEVADALMMIGLHGPGNIAWRALGRLVRPDSTVTDAAHWRAAIVLASGLRTLFNRPESMLLLDQLALDPVYWRAVLRYCAHGGLQAVLDEYLHHLRSSGSDLPLDDAGLLAIAKEASVALTLRPSIYRAFDPLNPDTPISLPSRFALRYGGRGGDDETARQPDVRNAFNSPFWPFVLAATSTGQEGIDFHWWCSAVVHWNTPTNPVDFEQREGRVHRFGGHAVRRNVAAEHRADALRSDDPDVWKAAYDAARSARTDLGDFAPYWVFPGYAKIERHLLPCPLSRDTPRLHQLKEDLVIYRLAFGQPRQEDMLTLLRRNGVVAADATPAILSLRPHRD